MPQLQHDARDQDEFNLKIRRLQNSVIKDLIGRILLIKEFNQHKDTVGEKHSPAEYVDNAIADRLKDQFDNDRAKFLAYLRDRGVTLRDYRQEVEEEIIYRYMRGQERNLDKDANAQRAKPGPQVHLRMIQLKRAADETDAALLARADVILGRFKHGEAFEALAREFDEDKRRDKGGDWGWQSAADLKAEYSEKLFAMKVGEVSAPMVSKEGCFLLFVEGRK